MRRNSGFGLRDIIGALLLSAVLAASGGAARAAEPPAGPISAAIACEALAKEDFTKVAEAPASVTSAHLVAETPSTHEYCDVVGVVQPQEAES